MTSTNNKKSPVEYDSHRHLFYNHDAQHGVVQFCALRGEKDHGEWVTLEGMRPLSEGEILRGARCVLPLETPEIVEIGNSCKMGVDDRMFRKARIKSKQLRWAYRTGRMQVVRASI